MSELLERLGLAWRILVDRDSSLVKHVRREFAMVDRSVELHGANLARVFDLDGHSGGSAPIVIGWLSRALSRMPIAPLTGDESEWMDVSHLLGRPGWQNIRCSRVFREADGSAFDVAAIVFKEPNGATYTNGSSRVEVKFPYSPNTKVVEVA